MEMYEYGFWGAVIGNALFFILFTAAFFVPKRRIEWRSLGFFSAFIVALFTEMYGFPLTIFILTSLLADHYPVLEPFAHENGHLFAAFFGGGGQILTFIHLVSNAMILGGFALVITGWRKVHQAQGLVTDGIYARMRHPQYAGLFLVTMGLMIQWPTLATLVVWPVLAAAYIRLARKEERELLRTFGEDYLEYARMVPRFFPSRRPFVSRKEAAFDPLS